MNRTILRQLANERIEDSRVLLDRGRWSAAYYLIGYSVESGLKACILKFVEETGVIFTDRKFAERCWTHRIEDLVKQADLEPILGRDIGMNPTLGKNWNLVCAWTEATRYATKSEAEARQIFDAVTNDPDGVLLWVRRHW